MRNRQVFRRHRRRVIRAVPAGPPWPSAPPFYTGPGPQGPAAPLVTPIHPDLAEPLEETNLGEQLTACWSLTQEDVDVRRRKIRLAGYFPPVQGRTCPLRLGQWWQ